jgi:hypothetical protein
VFEEKYCTLGELVEYRGDVETEQGGKYLVFRIPAGVSIFAPIEGRFGVGGSPLFSGVPAMGIINDANGVADSEDITFVIAGDVQPLITEDVEAGAVTKFTTPDGKEVYVPLDLPPFTGPLINWIPPVLAA